MKTGVAALFAAFIAVELLNKADSQTERCGYIRGIVRLRGGQHEREGRVQVCNNDQWGQLCGNGWDSDDAVVVCRQLGLLSTDTVAIAVNSSLFGEGSGSTWLTNLSCTGAENTIVDCLTPEQLRNAWPPQQCHSHAGILCLETDGGRSVQLVGGRNEREGRVEVYHEGAWHTVCGGNEWGVQEASTVCRELGLFENGALSVNGDQFRGEWDPYRLVNGIQCSGTESRLALCRSGTWTTQQCPSGSAGVVCPQSGGCREDSIRLVGGETVRQGRVEVCHGGVWGSLCKEGGGQWLNTDADLVCRQLQFQQQDERGAQVVSIAEFGPGNGVIWRFTAVCGRLFSESCTPSDWVSGDCTHSSDLAITCPEPKEQLQICVNISTLTFFTHDTLYGFFASVASRVVTEVLAGCSQPCSYTTRDVLFESSWPSPIHPTTMCMPRDAILGVKLTSRYRPHLNENGRVQLAVHTTLNDLGTIINCASYSRYVITKDIDLENCNSSRSTTDVPQTTLPSVENTRDGLTTADIIKSTTVNEDSTEASLPSITETTQRSKSSQLDVRVSTQAQIQSLVASPLSKTLPTSVNTYDSHSVTVTEKLSKMETSKSRRTTSIGKVPPAATNSPRNPTNEDEKPAYRTDYLFTALIGLLAVSLVLLVLCLLVALVLCVKRRTKKAHFQSAANLSASAHNPMHIHSTNPIVTHHDTGYYEDVDTHQYAVLEPIPLPEQRPRELTLLSDTSAASTDHGYFYMDHSLTTRQHSVGVTREDETLGHIDLDPEGLYSRVDNAGPEYATLEPEPGNETSVANPAKYSHLHDTTGQHLHHDYQRMLPDPSIDYDRTFASSSVPEPHSRIKHI